MQADLRDISDQTALVAVQGPRAFEIVGRVAGRSLDHVPFYHFEVPESGTFLGCERAILSHTGYTGEPGLEIAVPMFTGFIDLGTDRHTLIPPSWPTSRSRRTSGVPSKSAAAK